VGAFAAGFCVLGNLLYVMVPSIYFIVFSRICSGVGSGLEPILMGLLGRAYSPEERSAVFSQHMLAREMGLIRDI
jgi:MFS family permease